MQTADIQSRWLNFFGDRGHTVVPCASLVSDDPTLLFTVAGMVPFVPYLTGLVPAPYPRATSVQKCIRTLDIEEVGKTPRHGTFFQMNGNFCFGDYFKEGAIGYAWELLTTGESDGGLGFDEKDLWVTVYKDDDEAIDLWKKIAGLPDERIQRLDMDTNYWSTGQPGPAGPCSEIFFDRGPAYGIDGGPATDDDRYVEIWNLVFMQYLRGEGSGKNFEILGELPKKNIDTGMGMERVAFIKQGVENMYEIDQVRPVLDRAAELSGRRYGADHDDDVRMRVIADHVRSSLMLMSDGVSPSNEGRGYILRRLMRRTVRAMRLLGVEEPTFAELFPASRDAMKAAYPEVATEFPRIERLALGEEEAFLRTLASGTTILDVAVTKTKDAGATELPADTTFLLHDTFGFPIDLTLEIAEEAGLTVDRDAFDTLLQHQRTTAKADAKSKKGLLADLSVYGEFRAAGETVFTGYDYLDTETTVLGLIVDGASVTSALGGPDRRGHPRRDVALPGVRRPGGRLRPHRRRRLRPRGARRAAPGQGTREPHRAGDLGRGRGRGCRDHRRRPGVAARGDPGPLGDPPHPRCSSPDPRTGGAPVRLVQQGRLHAPRLQLEPGAVAGDQVGDRGGRQQRRARQPRGHDAHHEPRRGEVARCDGAVRREVRRHRARRRDRRPVVARALRRHARRARRRRSA